MDGSGSEARPATMGHCGGATPLVLLQLILFAAMMFVPLGGYRLAFEVFGPFFPFLDARFVLDAAGQPMPEAALLNGYLVLFLCVSLLTVFANVVATLVCLRLVSRLRETSRPLHFGFALIVWFLLLSLLLASFHLHERLGYAAADSAPTLAFYETEKSFAFEYLARNMPTLYGYVFDNGRTVADFVFWSEFAVLASFMPPLSLGVLCLAGSGFLPVGAARTDLPGRVRMLVARHAAIGQSLYVLAALFLFVVAFPSATFKLALAFPMVGAVDAVRDAHPLAQSQNATTLLIATSAVIALFLAYLPASFALDIARSRAKRAAEGAGVDNEALEDDWLMPSMRQNFAMVSPMLVPVLNLIVR